LQVWVVVVQYFMETFYFRGMRNTTLPRPSLRNKNRKKIVPIPYLPKLTSHIGEVIKSINETPIFYPFTRIGSLFPKGKDIVPPLSRSGVYLLLCRDCPAAYVGETGRAFRTRISEHKTAYKNDNPAKSAFTKHLLDLNHHADHQAHLLYYENRVRRRKALENIAIAKLKYHHALDLLNYDVKEDDLLVKIYSNSPAYENTEV